MCVGGGGGGGGGYNWDIKIFNATNCERRRRKGHTGGGGGRVI